MTAVARHISDPDRSLARQLNVRSLPSAVRVGAAMVVAAALLWPLAPLMVDAASADAWSSRTVSAAWFSVWQGLLAAALGVGLSIPIGWALAREVVPARRLVRALLTAPIVMPALAMALAASWLLDAGTLLLIPVNAGFGLAVGVRLGERSWTTLDPRELETARTLGLSSSQIARWHLLPALGRPYAAAGALAFALAISSAGGAILLAAPRPTLTTLAGTPTAGQQPSEAAAVALASLVAVALLLFLRWRPRPAVVVDVGAAAEESSGLGRLGPAARALVVGAFAVAIAFVVAPLVALIHAAVTIGASEQITAANIVAIFEDVRPFEVDPSDALRRSLALAVGALAVAVPLGSLTAVLIAPLRGWTAAVVELALFLPLFLGVALAAGLGRAGVDGSGALWWVHVTIALPLVVRMVLPAARARLHPQFEAATLLGASRWASWSWLVAGALRAQLIVAAALAFAWSIGEVGAAMLLHRIDSAPATVAIVRSLEEQSSGADGRAAALAALLVLSVTILFVTIEYRRSREITEF